MDPQDSNQHSISSNQASAEGTTSTENDYQFVQSNLTASNTRVTKGLRKKNNI